MVEDAGARPRGALPRGYARGEQGEPRPVWVRLAGGAYPAVDVDTSVPDGGFVGAHGVAPVPAGRHGRLDLAGEVKGRLHHWEREHISGAWFGVVDYSVALVDDLRPALRMSCVLVHADALRPREPATRDSPARHAP